MAEFTKGEWEIQGQHIVGGEERHTNGRKRNKLGISSASYSNVIAKIHGDMDLEAPKANARLIAAAPDLYAACDLALHNEGKRWSEIKKVLVAALAKARKEK